jgi:hypothetical protein
MIIECKRRSRVRGLMNTSCLRPTENRLLVCCVLVILLISSSKVAALPRFASRAGAKCQSCHIDPAGSGMRGLIGNRFGQDDLPVPGWTEGFDAGDLANLIPNLLGIGADFRTLYFAIQRPDGTSTNSIYQMQGDLYLNATITRRISLYLNKGLYSGFQAFGLLSVLPAHGFIKVGKFVPNFGTHLDDHTVAIRRETGFTPEDVANRYEKTGVEVGVAPGPFFLSTGVYNSLNNDLASNDKAFLARAEGMFRLGEEMNLGLGGSVFFSKTPTGDSRKLYGGFGSFTYSRVTIFGEGDVIRTEGEPQGISALAGYVEVDYTLTQGLDLKVAYDYFDPDLNIKSGSTSKYILGVEFFPFPGVEVRPLYRFVKDQPVDIKNDEFDLMVHFYL